MRLQRYRNLQSMLICTIHAYSIYTYVVHAYTKHSITSLGLLIRLLQSEHFFAALMATMQSPQKTCPHRTACMRWLLSVVIMMLSAVVFCSSSVRSVTPSGLAQEVHKGGGVSLVMSRVYPSLAGLGCLYFGSTRVDGASV